MYVGKAVYAMLSDDTDVYNSVSGRIYPHAIPQGESLPAITYSVVSESLVNNVAQSGGLSNATVQIQCIAESYATAREIAEMVRLALSGARGTFGSVAVVGCLMESATDLFQPPTDASDIGIYRVICTFSYWYRVAIP